jgi:peptidoglycan/LPS O-acetylase OafA/YrhL
MQPSKGAVEFPILESLRAFAATSVCLYHFVCTTTDYVHDPVVLKIFRHGEYGVHLFFIISGFIIPYSMYRGRYHIKNFFVFLGKRLLRLEPPYIVSIIIALILMSLRQHFYGDTGKGEITSMRIMLHFGYLIPFFQDQFHWINQVYWTLAIEFQYYIFMGLLFIPITSNNLFIRILFYILVAISSFAPPTYQLIYWLPVFLIGILLFLEHIKRINQIEFLLVSSLAFIWSLSQFHFGGVVIMFLGFILIWKYKEFSTVIGDFLGKMSYSFYLFHPLLGGTIINVLSHSYNKPIEKIFVFITGFILTVFGSYIMYLLVEKWSRKLSKKIVYSKPVSAV